MPSPRVTRHRKIWVLCAVSMLLLPGVGCRSSEQQPPPSVLKTHQQTVHVGLVPEEGVFSNAGRFRTLFRYLSRKTDCDIRTTIFIHYQDVVESFATKKIDAAFFGSYSYLLAREQTGAQPIARPEWRDGSSSYRGFLIVRKDSGIRSVGDMRGKRLVLVDRNTTAGYVTPLAYFRKRGIDHRTWFRETYFAGTHADAVRDVLNREADVGSAKSTVFERMAREDPRIRAELLVLDRSAEVPENSLVVRSDLDASVRERLTKAMLSMHDDPEGMAILVDFGARRFIPASDADYDPVRDYLRAAGIDLRIRRETKEK